MGIRGDLLGQGLRAVLALPDPRVGQEEPLDSRVSVDDGRVRVRPPLPGQGDPVGFQPYGDASQVADVLAQCEGASDVMGAVGVELGGDVGVVLGDEGRRPLFERPAVLVRPPVVDCPVRVELRALVVEAVAYLVADDGADRAVVERVVAIGVEEGELQDGSGEDDLVPQGGCSRR